MYYWPLFKYMSMATFVIDPTAKACARAAASGWHAGIPTGDGADVRAWATRAGGRAWVMSRCVGSVDVAGDMQP